MSLITIEQLLESVDLDFEPRWVTKDKSGLICVYTEKPEQGICSWYDGGNYIHIGYLKLAEFDGKDWTGCIYEVPRKVDYTKWIGKLCRFWDYGRDKIWYGILEEYHSDEFSGFCSDFQQDFSCCEPVRPDDDVIYKGE